MSKPNSITIGKSSESCGASLSDSASSVLTGVEFAGGMLGSAGRESVEQSDDVVLLDEEEEIILVQRETG